VKHTGVILLNSQCWM